MHLPVLRYQRVLQTAGIGGGHPLILNLTGHPIDCRFALTLRALSPLPSMATELLATEGTVPVALVFNILDWSYSERP